MTILELKEKIDDTSISDETLFLMMLTFFDGEVFNTANQDELVDLGAYTHQRRPKIMDMIQKLVIDQHRDCCCNDDACNEDDPK